MKKIKLGKIKFNYTNVSTEEYLTYLQLLNDRIDNFLIEISTLLNGYTDSHKRYIETIWDNIFLIAFFEINEKNTYESVIDSLFENDDEVNRKLNSFYLELSIIIPKEIIHNFKYNFYTVLINEYKIEKDILNHLESSMPYLFLIHLISKKWWMNKRELLLS